MLYVVGMGPGNVKNLTLEAIEVLKDAEMVIAFGRIAKVPIETRNPVKVVSKVEEIIKLLEVAEDAAILASGDPCFYGIIDYLQKNGIEIDKIIPGVSSFQYMMAKLKKSWQDAALMSLHGREQDLGRIRDYKTSVILTDKNNTPTNISKALKELGIKGILYAGINLSYEDEQIVKVEIGEEVDTAESLCVVVVENHDIG